MIAPLDANIAEMQRHWREIGIPGLYVGRNGPRKRACNVRAFLYSKPTLPTGKLERFTAAKSCQPRLQSCGSPDPPQRRSESPGVTGSDPILKPRREKFERRQTHLHAVPLRSRSATVRGLAVA